MSETKKNTTTPTKTEKYEAIDALLSQPPAEIKSLEGLLRKLPKEDQKEAFRILYGDLPDVLPIPEAVQNLANAKDFEVAAYKFHAAAEQRRRPRIVRIAVIQNQIVAPTSDPKHSQITTHSICTCLTNDQKASIKPCQIEKNI